MRLFPKCYHGIQPVRMPAVKSYSHGSIQISKKKIEHVRHRNRETMSWPTGCLFDTPDFPFWPIFFLPKHTCISITHPRIWQRWLYDDNHKSYYPASVAGHVSIANELVANKPTFRTRLEHILRCWRSAQFTYIRNRTSYPHYPSHELHYPDLSLSESVETKNFRYVFLT